MKRASSPDNQPIGRIFVAKYYPNQPLPPLPTENCKNILVHSSAKDFAGALSPYHLKNEQGQLLENVWQFSKVYRSVYPQKQRLSKKYPNSPVTWEHPAEQHIGEDDKPTPQYWAWRDKGFNNKYAVRYPNGYAGRTECLYAIWKGKKLDYIEARKQIYVGEYRRLAPKLPVFQQIRKMLDEGIDVQLVEVDGPDPKMTHGPYEGKSVMEMTPEKLEFLLNDPIRPFGHGFTIALLLIEEKEKRQKIE